MQLDVGANSDPPALAWKPGPSRQPLGPEWLRHRLNTQTCPRQSCADLQIRGAKGGCGANASRPLMLARHFYCVTERRESLSVSPRLSKRLLPSGGVDLLKHTVSPGCIFIVNPVRAAPAGAALACSLSHIEERDLAEAEMLNCISSKRRPPDTS